MYGHSGSGCWPRPCLADRCRRQSLLSICLVPPSTYIHLHLPATAAGSPPSTRSAPEGWLALWSHPIATAGSVPAAVPALPLVLLPLLPLPTATPVPVVVAVAAVLTSPTWPLFLRVPRLLLRLLQQNLLLLLLLLVPPAAWIWMRIVTPGLGNAATGNDSAPKEGTGSAMPLVRTPTCAAGACACL
jgi:hypothetical protein